MYVLQYQLYTHYAFNLKFWNSWQNRKKYENLIRILCSFKKVMKEKRINKLQLNFAVIFYPLSWERGLIHGQNLKIDKNKRFFFLETVTHTNLVYISKVTAAF